MSPLTKQQLELLDKIKKNDFRNITSLPDDHEFMLVAVEENAYALNFALDHFKADREIVLAAVKESGFALQYASPELKADREVVLEAVKQNPSVLQYASDAMMNILVFKSNDKTNEILSFLQNYNIDLATRKKLAAICLEKVEPVCFSRRRRNILSAAEKIRREFEDKNVVKKGQRKEQEEFEKDVFVKSKKTNR